MTMNNWSGIYSKNITVHHKRWCPACLNQFKQELGEIYEPLIWYIADINKCDIHQVPLQEHCPNCRKKLPLMSSNMILGYCQYCFIWLGDTTNANFQERTLLTNDEKFIIKNYKQLIEMAPKLKYFPIKNTITNKLKKIKEDLGFSSMTKFSNFLDINNPTVWTWINGQSLPSPEKILQIVKKINYTTFEMITEDHFDIKQDITNNKNITVKKKFSKDLVEAHLLNALNLDIPKSLAQVCREGGFSVRAAKNNFPLLSKRIKDKYANYQKEKRLQKQKMIENVLNDCLNMDVPISLKECLEKIGVPPTTAKRYADDLCKKVAERYDEYKKIYQLKEKINYQRN